MRSWKGFHISSSHISTQSKKITGHEVVVYICPLARLNFQEDIQESSSGAPPLDIIVPVSASYTNLTPAFLNSLLDISPAEPPCIVLAIVDSDGTVVLNRLYRGIQAPAEGFTGTDTLGTGKRNQAPNNRG